ncbi:MAG: uracil-DNA glycosylase family protein [Pseudohongiellaceae bacterium]
MTQSNQIILQNLLQDIKQCSLCAPHIPSPNPVLSVGNSAKILIIGQAPGSKVHASGIPWNDASGDRLRRWMGIEKKVFYDKSLIAIVPMGFCYPGKGKSGDLPPRPECVRTWHKKVLDQLPNIQCTLLIGQYAQLHYHPEAGKTVTERVSNWRSFTPKVFMLPHPSPRNLFWFSRHPWFEEDTVPALQKALSKLVNPQTNDAE